MLKAQKRESRRAWTCGAACEILREFIGRWGFRDIGCELGEKGGLGRSKKGPELGPGVGVPRPWVGCAEPHHSYLLQVDVLIPVANPDSWTVQVLRHRPQLSHQQASGTAPLLASSSLWRPSAQRLAKGWDPATNKWAELGWAGLSAAAPWGLSPTLHPQAHSASLPSLVFSWV